MVSVPLIKVNTIDYNMFSMLRDTFMCVRTQRIVAGVLFVQIHSASGLLSADADGLSDPYCVVLANKRKVIDLHKYHY